MVEPARLSGFRGDRGAVRFLLMVKGTASWHSPTLTQLLSHDNDNHGGAAWRWRIGSERIPSGFDLKEARKWGKPCYTIDGKNVVIILGFREYCALGFFQGALPKDPILSFSTALPTKQQRRTRFG